MLTSTSLNHPTVQRNLYVALHRAVRLSKRNGTEGVVYLNNAQGKPFLRVRHCRTNGFDFYAGNKELSKKVLTSLRQGVKIDLSIK